MITLLPESHDLTTSHLDALAAEHGLAREEAIAWTPDTMRAPATDAPVPVLSFRRDDELGEYFERICEAISSGTCDELVRQMEADYARLLLKAQRDSG